MKRFVEYYLEEKDMSHCDCKNPKGFSCKAHLVNSKGKVARTGGEYKGKKVKSKKVWWSCMITHGNSISEIQTIT